jgi:hypothetical protein
MEGRSELSLRELTPKSNIENGQTYFQALDFAFQEDSIRNIAITGHYGSGKSSIIKSYFNIKPHIKKCEISLASFEFNDIKNNDLHYKIPGKINTEEQNNLNQTNTLEQSILQQIVYQVSPDKIPLSRFRRIVEPKKAAILSFSSYGVLFLLFALILLNQDKFWDDLSLDKPSSFIWFFVALVCFSSFAYLAGLLYRRFPDLNIKKISVANGEIESDDKINNSVLNAYIEEILYYFEKIDIDVVVFEDLDRFDNYEIFSKLRELNKVLNGYEGIPKTVKFVYAVKDSILSGVSKPKFFDLVIPVIPIVDYSNSKDKLLERNNSTNFKLTEQLLIDISVFVSDLRLIHNIFNEFEIYAAILGAERQSYDKIFCYIVYKNINPNDFSDLYLNKGAVFEAISNLNTLRTEKSNEFQVELNKLNKKVSDSETALTSESSKLISLIIGEVLKSVPENEHLIGFILDDNVIPLSKVYDREHFESLLQHEKLVIATAQSGTIVMGSTKFIVTDALNGESYEEQVAKIETKFTSKKTDIYERIRLLNSCISNVMSMALSDLISADYIEDICKKHGVKDYRLLAYFLKNSYIDQNYSLYISIFHEGAISADDQIYLMNVLSEQSSEFTYKLDNPINIINMVSEDNFRKPFLLNFQLVEQLFKPENTIENKPERLTEMLVANIEDVKDFLLSFHQQSKNPESFYEKLVSNEAFSSKVFKLSFSQQLLPILVSNIATKDLISNLDSSQNLTNFLTSQLSNMNFQNMPGDNIRSLITELKIKIPRLSDFQNNDDFLNYLIDNEHFDISFINISFLIARYSNDKPSLTYSSVRNDLPDSVTRYLQSNLSEFIDEVLLHPEATNTQHTNDLVELVNLSDLSPESITQLLENNPNYPIDYTEVPRNLRSRIVSSGLCDFDWEQLSDFSIESDGFITLFNEWINHRSDLSKLSKTKLIDSNVTTSNQKNLARELYDSFVPLVPAPTFSKLIISTGYVFEEFPESWNDEIAAELVKGKVLNFNSGTFSGLSEFDEILADFLIQHFDKFKQLHKVENVTLSLDVVSRLINSSISNANKLYLLRSSVTEADEHKSYDIKDEKLIKLLLSAAGDLSIYDQGLVHKLIQDSGGSDDAKCLLTKWAKCLDVGEIKSTLHHFKYPYSGLGNSIKKPRIPVNDANRALLGTLKNTFVIKDFKENPGESKFYVTNFQ